MEYVYLVRLIFYIVYFISRKLSKEFPLTLDSINYFITNLLKLLVTNIFVSLQKWNKPNGFKSQYFFLEKDFILYGSSKVSNSS